MRVDYPAVIRDPAEELAQHERALRGMVREARVRLLRWLKQGAAATLVAGQLVSYSEPQARRWWASVSCW